MENKKTVFFGPFVGEFGWELLWWQGWVKKVCRTRYKDYHKIACSVSGRHIFYPDADEFLPIPKWFFEKPVSSRGYITDCWINGWPTPNSSAAELEDVYPRIQKIIDGFKERLPEDTEFVFPWMFRNDDEYGKMGMEIPENPEENSKIIIYNIAYDKQILEYLNPSKKGMELFKEVYDGNERLIAIFPRMRKYRRPDKNWEKDKYNDLIDMLQKKFPYPKIAIFGEPGGAFFADDMPDGCIDLINVNADYRMDIQCAALKQSVIAIGSQSGAIDFALASGCDAITWGPASGEKVFLTENFMKVPMTFIPFQNPDVSVVVNYVEKMLGHRKLPPIGFEIKKQAVSKFYRVLPRIVMKSTTLSRIKKKFSG